MQFSWWALYWWFRSFNFGIYRKPSHYCRDWFGSRLGSAFHCLHFRSDLRTRRQTNDRTDSSIDWRNAISGDSNTKLCLLLEQYSFCWLPFDLVPETQNVFFVCSLAFSVRPSPLWPSPSLPSLFQSLLDSHSSNIVLHLWSFCEFTYENYVYSNTSIRCLSVITIWDIWQNRRLFGLKPHYSSYLPLITDHWASVRASLRSSSLAIHLFPIIPRGVPPEHSICLPFIHRFSCYLCDSQTIEGKKLN